MDGRRLINTTMHTVGGGHAWMCVYFKSHKLKCLYMKMKRLTRVRLKWLDLTIGLKNEERTMQPGRKQQEQTEARCCHFTLCVSWQNGPKTRHKKPTERSLSPCWNVAVTRQLVLYIQAVWPHSEHENVEQMEGDVQRVNSDSSSGRKHDNVKQVDVSARGRTSLAADKSI